MNRRLLTPGIKIETADAFNWNTSNIANNFTINGNNVEQSAIVTTTAYTPALDIGTITTMSKRGGAPAAASANNVTVIQSISSGPTGVSKTRVKVAFPEFRIVTNAGAPTQILLAGPGPAGAAVVPAALFPPFLKQWVVPFIDNGLPVAARLFLNTSGVMVATLMASTAAIPVAFTAPFGFNGDQEVEYVLD